MRSSGFIRRSVVGLAVAASLGLTGAAAWAQDKYKDAPSLADQVKAGKLPPVSQRLPENPLVAPVVDSVGQYGGVWRR
ncbi:MAG: ABC transporter substrate-binding protein, partial [Reyranellales bacterium]